MKYGLYKIKQGIKAHIPGLFKEATQEYFAAYLRKQGWEVTKPAK